MRAVHALEERIRCCVGMSTSMRRGGTSPAGTGAVTVARVKLHSEGEPGFEEPGSTGCRVGLSLVCSGEGLQIQRGWD